jgi:phosphoglycolate phosphatase-like HAD superfamily hydrolase
VTDPTVAVLDIDGTLIDSNYQHALAWYRALRSVGETYPVWRLHRLIGMGGDQVVPAIGGKDLERRVGDQARVWDVEAAKKAGRPAIVVRSGGFGDDELKEAGAIASTTPPASSRRHWRTPLLPDANTPREHRNR